ncbi:hypothetical protein [Pseudochrobactrum sp. HB0163]|uniref:COG4223 family protein n=1 Tax=Pseudochrobactrum sp. HB0163 TaxID=3450708 RepID=UPI003F6DD21F
MAKSTVTRHSKTPRKPAMIDLEASEVKPAGRTAHPKIQKSAAKSVPDAEPVGDYVKPSLETGTASPVKSQGEKPQGEKADKPQSGSQAPFQAGSQSSSQAASSSGRSGPNPYASGKTMNTAGGTVSQPKNTGSAWLSGIAGGVIALLGAAALQWSGFLPFAPQPASDTGALQASAAQIANLQQQIAAIKTAPAKPDAELLTRLENAEKAATQAQQQLAELVQAGTAQTASDDRGLRAEMAALQEQLKALESRAPSAAAALPDDVGERLDRLEERLKTIGSQAEQTAAAANNDTDMIRSLKQQLAAMQTKVDKQATQPDMAAIIAANALKTAVDRGGSFKNELQTYLSLAPQQKGVASGLEALAAKGVPTLSQMNTQFSSLADDMVAAVNRPAADAGIWAQLTGSAKGLIRSRPVGDVAGSDAGAVTARIEFALQNGDVQRAVTEWAQLPETAKQVGQHFYQALVARRDADALLTRLIAATLQDAPAQPEPAAQ